MCGITGYIATKRHAGKRAKQNLADLLINSSSRGKDATGIAYVEGDNIIHTIKAPGTASDFVKLKGFKRMIKHESPDVLIGHARAKTQGDEKDNNNNHPLTTANGLALVHNGIISNDESLFLKYKTPRTGEVDSEIIIRLIDHFHTKERKSMVSSIQKMAKEVAGSMACAMIDAKHPDELYLWACTSPCVLVYEHSTGVIYFGSTEDILKDSLIQYHYLFGLFAREMNANDLTFLPIVNNTGVILRVGQKETTMTEVFEIERTITTRYSSYYDARSQTTIFSKDAGNKAYDSWQKKEEKKEKKKEKRLARLRLWGNAGCSPEPSPLPVPHLLTDTTGVHVLEKYNPKNTILRPSLFSDEVLMMREAFLLDIIKNNAATDKELSELQRIKNCLDDRQVRKITSKNCDMIFPDPSDDFVETDETELGGHRKIEMITPEDESFERLSH